MALYERKLLVCYQLLHLKWLDAKISFQDILSALYGCTHVVLIPIR